MENIVYDFLGRMACEPDVIEAVVGASHKGRAARIRRLGSQIRKLEKDLEETKREITNLTDVAARLGADGFSADLRQRCAEASKRRDGILAETHSLKREQSALKDEQDQRKRVQDGLHRFASLVRTLPESEQKELVQLIINDIVVNVPDSQDALHITRKVLIDMRLRMGALVKTRDQNGRTLKVNLELTLHRSKAWWARAEGPISIEVGRPQTKKKREVPSRKHEIHRAQRLAKEMARDGWSAADLSRRYKMSRAGISQILRWNQLSDEAKHLLLKLGEGRMIRRCSRRFRETLLKMPKSAHLEALKERLRMER
ncbi:MAG: hypothetical protein JJT96_06695 [Opitutales bacterium]|nr:hypothetical protein [Opitutales bacterium]